MNCPFCELRDESVLAESELCIAIETRDAVLVGSAMVVPRAHRETPFDLSAEEWAETRVLLLEVQRQMESRWQPAGYNVGWNSGAGAGQEVPHAHLHVIPRFADEPLAGKGIRYALRQPTNTRPSQS